MNSMNNVDVLDQMETTYNPRYGDISKEEALRLIRERDGANTLRHKAHRAVDKTFEFCAKIRCKTIHRNRLSELGGVIHCARCDRYYNEIVEVTSRRLETSNVNE